MAQSKFIIGYIISLLATSVFAATVTGTLPINASVSAVCNINPGSLNFGSYDPISANSTNALTATGTFGILCTKGTSVTLSLNTGVNNTHAIGTTRAMVSGTNYLSYELYTSAARNTVWDTTNTVIVISTTKNTTTQSVWGTIPAGQDIQGGLTYTDSVIITASF